MAQNDSSSRSPAWIATVWPLLTGLAIGPEKVPVDEWLPHIFGGETPVFKDNEPAARILVPLLIR